MKYLGKMWTKNKSSRRRNFLIFTYEFGDRRRTPFLRFTRTAYRVKLIGIDGPSGSHIAMTYRGRDAHAVLLSSAINLHCWRALFRHGNGISCYIHIRTI
ncbi:hypothetical protein K435DRAFT_342389 [Dendrothele bispora CBS 962.96]|uniref:Uncharacterized protein n=1 Tax=Dendrothele bispora (strain CBS 962.96) TaxID=1314807 RepID=A0A4S8LEI7_DENBC|nr:hypothetical protein K435DRAFT_342389 [Dendrothele bispora CBS 962.96]